jgi:flagellar M-ring protein FliF
VQVSAIPFPAMADTPAEEEPDESGGIMTLIPTIIGGLVLVIVAVALLLMSRGGKKRAKKGEVVEIAQGALPGGSGHVVDARDMANQQVMAGLTDDVIDLVDRQPEEIATLLRSWLADRRDEAS